MSRIITIKYVRGIIDEHRVEKWKNKIIADTRLISKLKKQFKSSSRTTYYQGANIPVNSIDCYAVPGTLESAISILEKLKKNKSGTKPKLLNVGGGINQTSSIFQHLGYSTTNLDILIKKDNSKNKHFDLNNPKKFPFEDERFDVVVCQEIIEHIENPWHLIRRIKRVLKKGGFLIISTPNILSDYSKKIFSKTGRFHWFQQHDMSYHINPIPYWEIEEIVSQNNLTIKGIYGSGDYFFKRNESVRKEQIIKNNECIIFSIEKEGK